MNRNGMYKQFFLILILWLCGRLAFGLPGEAINYNLSESDDLAGLVDRPYQKDCIKTHNKSALQLLFNDTSVLNCNNHLNPDMFCHCINSLAKMGPSTPEEDKSKKDDFAKIEKMIKKTIKDKVLKETLPKKMRSSKNELTSLNYLSHVYNLGFKNSMFKADYNPALNILGSEPLACLQDVKGLPEGFEDIWKEYVDMDKGLRNSEGLKAKAAATSSEGEFANAFLDFLGRGENPIKGDIGAGISDQELEELSNKLDQFMKTPAVRELGRGEHPPALLLLAGANQHGRETFLRIFYSLTRNNARDAGNPVGRHLLTDVRLLLSEEEKERLDQRPKNTQELLKDRFEVFKSSPIFHPNNTAAGPAQEQEVNFQYNRLRGIAQAGDDLSSRITDNSGLLRGTAPAQNSTPAQVPGVIFEDLVVDRLTNFGTHTLEDIDNEYKKDAVRERLEAEFSKQCESLKDRLLDQIKKFSDEIDNEYKILSQGSANEKKGQEYLDFFSGLAEESLAGLKTDGERIQMSFRVDQLYCEKLEIRETAEDALKGLTQKERQIVNRNVSDARGYENRKKDLNRDLRQNGRDIQHTVEKILQRDREIERHRNKIAKLEKKALHQKDVDTAPSGVDFLKTQLEKLETERDSLKDAERELRKKRATIKLQIEKVAELQLKATKNAADVVGTDVVEQLTGQPERDTVFEKGTEPESTGGEGVKKRRIAVKSGAADKLLSNNNTSNSTKRKSMKRRLGYDSDFTDQIFEDFDKKVAVAEAISAKRKGLGKLDKPVKAVISELDGSRGKLIAKKVAEKGSKLKKPLEKTGAPEMELPAKKTVASTKLVATPPSQTIAKATQVVKELEVEKFVPPVKKKVVKRERERTIKEFQDTTDKAKELEMARLKLELERGRLEVAKLKAEMNDFRDQANNKKKVEAKPEPQATITTTEDIEAFTFSRKSNGGGNNTVEKRQTDEGNIGGTEATLPVNKAITGGNLAPIGTGIGRNAASIGRSTTGRISEFSLDEMSGLASRTISSAEFEGIAESGQTSFRVKAPQEYLAMSPAEQAAYVEKLMQDEDTDALFIELPDGKVVEFKKAATIADEVVKENSEQIEAVAEAMQKKIIQFRTLQGLLNNSIPTEK